MDAPRRIPRLFPEPDEADSEENHHQRAHYLGPNLPGRSRENARSHLEREAKNDRPTERARDHCNRKNERIDKTGLALGHTLTPDDGEPESHIPWAGESKNEPENVTV